MHLLTICFAFIHFSCLAASGTTIYDPDDDVVTPWSRWDSMFECISKTIGDWPSLQRAIQMTHAGGNFKLELAEDLYDFLIENQNADKDLIRRHIQQVIQDKLVMTIYDGTVEQVAGKLFSYLEVMRDPEPMDRYDFITALMGIDKKPLKHFG